MIHIISFSDNFQHFAQPIQEYQKRTQAYITTHILSPSRMKTPKEIVMDESRRLEKFFDDKKMARGYKIYLDIGDFQLSSEQLLQKQQAIFQHHAHIYYVIGGAYGVSREVIDRLFDSLWSISPLTLPHSLAFLVAFEQLYRVHEMQKGSKYHHPQRY